MLKNHTSIFKKYYQKNKLSDRYEKGEGIGIDVIIPIINTNELWETNLYSFYKEIPISRLLIGDGGCTDDSLLILNQFPRVEVFNQEKYISQGYCIKELMLMVTSEHFIYLHADVFLPKGWFDSMYKYKNDYDWFECFRRMTLMFEYPHYEHHQAKRAFSGSQLGKTEIMKRSIQKIDDDYLQRNEDIIFAELIKQFGGKYAKIDDTFHYHQITNKEGDMEPDLKAINIIKKEEPKWEKRIFNMQYKGIIKYINVPEEYLIENIYRSIFKLIRLKDFNWREFYIWTKKTNKIWLKYVHRRGFFVYLVKRGISLILAR